MDQIRMSWMNQCFKACWGKKAFINLLCQQYFFETIKLYCDFFFLVSEQPASSQYLMGIPLPFEGGLISTLWLDEFSLLEVSSSQTSPNIPISRGARCLRLPPVGEARHTASSQVSPLHIQHHVTGFNAWTQKPNGRDLGTGCICKSVKIFFFFFGDRQYRGIRLWLKH